MSDETREPLTIDVEIDKEARLVALTMREGTKQVRLLLPDTEALQLGRKLREAVHHMGKQKVKTE